jgi:hypothetical protein
MVVYNSNTSTEDAAYNITGITGKVHVRGYKGPGQKDRTASIIQGPPHLPQVFWWAGRTQKNFNRRNLINAHCYTAKKAKKQTKHPIQVEANPAYNTK